MRPATTSPTDTAGLRWQPEIGPIAYAIVRTVKPKASETPSQPTWPPASTAVPHPPSTSQNVPIASAKSTRPFDIGLLLTPGKRRNLARGCGFVVKVRPAPRRLVDRAHGPSTLR